MQLTRRPTSSHDQAVGAMQESLRAIAPGDPIRLAKKTSNLFRPRSASSSPGLDVSHLDSVIWVDPATRTADVQGMCTYESLVAATLTHNLMPLVVPQLKTITVGGAVTGLGIESTSFRHGLPHESVLEMDILTGEGKVVTARPDGEHADLFHAFPNSYGSLGYALRLRVELRPVSTYVALRHVRFGDLDELADAVTAICRDRAYNDVPVEFLDGVMFSPQESYLTLGRFVDDVTESGLLAASDYTGQQIFYRSIQERARDVVTTQDYIWRWDTDWFWCSRAFGAQHRVLRRVWPAKYRRSDVYHSIVGLENKYGVIALLDRLRGNPARERVVQDVEIPIERIADFLHWFDDHVGMRPVWLCPLMLRETAGTGSAGKWPLYPLQPGQVYVNAGFWGMVSIPPSHAEGGVNAMIERAVADHAGHKSLYSDAYYEEDHFYAIYGGSTYHNVKGRYDPQDRLTGLYDKAVGRR